MRDVAKNLQDEAQQEVKQPTVYVEPNPADPVVKQALNDLLEDVPFDLPEKPDVDAPPWPRNLADLADEDLGEHMAYWSAMVAYANFHLSVADSDRKILEWRAERQRSETLASVYEDNVAVARATADIHSDVVAAYEKHFAAETRYKVLNAVADGFNQRYQSCSREITRRIAQRERKM